MTSTEELLPDGEKMRRCIRWVSDTLQEHPDKSRKDAFLEAEVRFDLSPKECAFLNANFTEKSR